MHVTKHQRQLGAARELRASIDRVHERLDALIEERRRLNSAGSTNEQRVAEIAAEESALDLKAAELTGQAESRFGLERFLRMTA